MLSAGIITPVSQPQEQRAHRLSHATLPMPGCPYPHTDGGNLLSSSLCSEESKQFFRNPSMVPEGLLNSDCNSSDQGSVNDPALVMGSTAATIGSSRGDMMGLEDSMKIDSDDDQVAALNEELPKTPIRQHRASTTELMNNKAALSGNLSGAGMARSQSLVNCSHKDWNSGSSQSSQTTSSNFLFLCSNKRFYRFASFIEDLDLSDLTDNTSSHGGSPRWSPVETAQARPTTPEDQAKQEQLGKVMEVYQENGVTSDFILDILRSRRRTDREANEFLWYLCQQDWHDFNEYDDVGFTFGCLSFRWYNITRTPNPGIILGMGSSNETRRYYVTPLLIGRAHTQNDPESIELYICIYIHDLYLYIQCACTCYGADNRNSHDIDFPIIAFYMHFLQIFPFLSIVNTLRPKQYGGYFADHILKCIFLNENYCILIKISLKIVPRSPIDYKSTLLQVMA